MQLAAGLAARADRELFCSKSNNLNNAAGNLRLAAGLAARANRELFFPKSNILNHAAGNWRLAKLHVLTGYFFILNKPPVFPMESKLNLKHLQLSQ